MKYRVTISELTPNDKGSYNRYDTEDVYEQTVEQLDVGAVVDVVNRVHMTQMFPPVEVLGDEVDES